MSREHTPRPGITWETALVRTETFLPEDDGHPLAWYEDDPPDPPRPNRATRRAIRRARRRTATKEN